MASSGLVTINRPVGWLAARSVEQLRLAVDEVMPELTGRPLVLNDRVVTSNPRYFQGSAQLDGSYVVKFAWSESAARRIAHESPAARGLGKVRTRHLGPCCGRRGDYPGASHHPARSR